MEETSKDDLLKRAKKYSSIKYALSLAETAYIFILLLIFAASNFSGMLLSAILKLTANNHVILALYLFIIGLLFYVFNLPLNFYQSYVLEHKFNLSNQRFSDWLKDQVKYGIISYIIGFILISAFYYILRQFSLVWWLIISLFWIFFSLILARLTPIIIIPLFFKYKKLQDEILKERIFNLAKHMKVKILDCFEIDFSRKTLKANAAFVGLGKVKRVILADTLKDKYSHDEIEVILAHEFAHYKLKHLLKLIFLNSAVIILIFYLIFRTNKYILSIFGFKSLLDLAALPVIFIYFVIFGVIMQPFENYLSRKMEKNADRLALKVTGLKDAFISMMEKLSLQNLADRNPRPIIKFFFFDHPPIDERIDMAKSL